MTGPANEAMAEGTPGDGAAPAELEIRLRPVGPLQANCYRLACEGRAVLIDPGAEGRALLAWLERDDLTLDAVWLTHAHFDHVGGLSEVVAASGAPVHLHPADLPLLENAARAAAAWGLEIEPPPRDIVPTDADATLTFGGREFRALFTPGHAPGHLAFYSPRSVTLAGPGLPTGPTEGGVVLAGDTLFAGSIGRTDLPLADGPTLMGSIRRRLLPLPDATVVLPGHFGPTTIGAEARGNPFLS